MEEARVEAVLDALEEVEQGSGLGEAVEGQTGGLGGETGGGVGESELDGLGFEGADDAEADGGGDESAEVLEQEEMGGGIGGEAEVGEEDAEGRGEVAGLRGRRGVGEEGVSEGGPEGAALDAAGAVGDVVGGPDVAMPVEFGEVGGFLVGRHHEGEGGGEGLAQTGFEERSEVTAIGDFAELPGGFETPGVGEAAGGQGGVGQLEHEMERGVGQNRE